MPGASIRQGRLDEGLAAFLQARELDPLPSIIARATAKLTERARQEPKNDPILIFSKPARSAFSVRTNPTGTGVSPFWSRDAMKLYFAASPGVNAWSVVIVTTEPVFGMSAEDAVPGPTLAGGGPNLPRPHDIADDQHLVALVSAGAGEIRREQIQFVLNWNEELKQRVRAQ